MTASFNVFQIITLDIDTNTDTVTELDRNLLPERGGDENDGIMLNVGIMCCRSRWMHLLHAS